MPTRLLREGILSSDRVDQLDSAAEVFYRRLMSKVDDHGLFDARPSMLRATLFPLRIDRVREADITRWMAACQKAGLIVLYEADGKAFLKMLDTGWDERSKPKYPLPPENICKQVLTTESKSTVVVDVVVDEGVTRRKRRASSKIPIPENFKISPRVIAWAESRGIENLDRHFEHFVGASKAKDYRYADWDEALMNAVRNDWAKIGSGKRKVAM
jgi:hypothetical protein